ncbi:MAG: hypothetical protein EAY81_08750 [Bacteroidetes bacterium]|nr:MAG: hypothetical protein EAY81_08750 [Bacteroidota bacterium]
METTAWIGVWMDYSKANLIEYGEGEVIQTITSSFTPQKRTASLSHSESGMHHKEQQLHTQYFKSIADKIIKYNKVLLFGPTDAKLEFHHYLAGNPQFKKVNIGVEPTDRITNNQQKAFVNDYFKKHRYL